MGREPLQRPLRIARRRGVAKSHKRVDGVRDVDSPADQVLEVLEDRQVDPLPHASTRVRREPGIIQESVAASGVAESTHDVGDTGVALERREAKLDSGESLGAAVRERSSRDGDA